MNTLDTQQNDIMNSFDFDKVLKVMHGLDLGRRCCYSRSADLDQPLSA